jgi:hypothetical protein
MVTPPPRKVLVKAQPPAAAARPKVLQRLDLLTDQGGAQTPQRSAPGKIPAGLQPGAPPAQSRAAQLLPKRDTTPPSWAQPNDWRWWSAPDPMGSIREQQGKRSAEAVGESSWQRMAVARMGQPELVEISDEEYQAMSPTQRAAVDFNSAYFRATAADRFRSDAPSPDQRTQYDEALAGLFGENAGEGYAPDTAALLSVLGAQDLGTNVDDFLADRGGITDTEIGLLGMTPEQRTGNVLGLGGEYRMSQVQQLADKTAELTQKIQAGAEFAGEIPLSTFTGTSFADRVGSYIAAQGLNFGETSVDPAEAAAIAATTGFQGGPAMSPSGTNGFFETMFEAMVDKSTNPWTPADMNEVISEQGYDPTSFWTYVNSELARYDEGAAAGYNIRLGSDPLKEYLSAEELRATIGQG